jgi:DNA primase
LPGEPSKICRSPFHGEHKHGDANPSFSVFDEGRRWKNFATGEGGDVIDFVAKILGCSIADAIRWIQDRLGITRPERKSGEPKSPCLKIPPLHRGTESELHELVERRGFNADALRLAEQRGFLHFTTLWSHAAWCITDARRALFEFRRLAGRH